MNFVRFFAIIGIIAAVSGLIIIILSFTFLKSNKWGNFLTGLFFTLIGSVIAWLSLNTGKPFPINIGISDQLQVILLMCVGFGSFIIKGIMMIREGLSQLKDKKLSKLLIYKSRVNVFWGGVLIIGATCILVMASSWQL